MFFLPQERQIYTLFDILLLYLFLQGLTWLSIEVVNGHEKIVLLLFVSQPELHYIHGI